MKFSGAGCSREKSKPISIEEGIAVVKRRIHTEAVRSRVIILLLNFIDGRRVGIRRIESRKKPFDLAALHRRG
jgi:hypothetical protein